MRLAARNRCKVFITGIFMGLTVIFVLVAARQVPCEREDQVQSPAGHDPYHPPVVGRGVPVDEGEERAYRDVGGDAACEPAAEKAAFVGGVFQKFHRFAV